MKKKELKEKKQQLMESLFPGTINENEIMAICKQIKYIDNQLEKKKQGKKIWKYFIEQPNGSRDEVFPIKFSGKSTS